MQHAAPAASDDAKAEDSASLGTDDLEIEEESADGSSDVANKDKPLIWFNRQPSNRSTEELDMGH